MMLEMDMSIQKTCFYFKTQVVHSIMLMLEMQVFKRYALSRRRQAGGSEWTGICKLRDCLGLGLYRIHGSINV